MPIETMLSYAGIFMASYVSLLDGELFAELNYSFNPWADSTQRYPDFSSEQECRINISVNGMSNVDGDAMAKIIHERIGDAVYPIANPRFLWGIGDPIQSIAYELCMPDLLVANIADTIYEAYNYLSKNKKCKDPCIVIYAHSQGTMAVRRALFFVDSEISSHIVFCGYGGETAIDAKDFGLRSSNNYMFEDDPVTGYMPLFKPSQTWETYKGDKHEFSAYANKFIPYRKSSIKRN